MNKKKIENNYLVLEQKQMPQGTVANNLMIKEFHNFNDQREFLKDSLERVTISKSLDLWVGENGKYIQGLHPSLQISMNETPYDLIYGNWFLASNFENELGEIETKGITAYEIEYLSKQIIGSGNLDIGRDYLFEAAKEHYADQDLFTLMFETEEVKVYQNESNAYILNVNKEEVLTYDLSDKNLLSEYGDYLSKSNHVKWFDKDLEMMLNPNSEKLLKKFEASYNDFSQREFGNEKITIHENSKVGLLYTSELEDVYDFLNYELEVHYDVGTQQEITVYSNEYYIFEQKEYIPLEDAITNVNTDFDTILFNVPLDRDVLTQLTTLLHLGLDEAVIKETYNIEHLEIKSRQLSSQNVLEVNNLPEDLKDDIETKMNLKFEEISSLKLNEQNEFEEVSTFGKVIQRFKGEILDVSFDNEQVFKTVAWITEKLHEQGCEVEHEFVESFKEELTDTWLKVPQFSFDELEYDFYISIESEFSSSNNEVVFLEKWEENFPSTLEHINEHFLFKENGLKDFNKSISPEFE